MKPKKTTAAKKKKATKTVAPKTILPKARPKAQVQTQTGKTQGQTQRQIVNVVLQQPARGRVPRQVKQATPVSTQTFYIERSPSQVISSDPFKSGVIQKNKEAQTEKQTSSVSTNVGAVSRLVPGIEEDIKKPQLSIQSQQPISIEGSMPSYNIGTVDFEKKPTKTKKEPEPGRRPVGRPPGSKNKPKLVETDTYPT